MLAPVTVSTAHQGKSVGQSLIRFGLNELKNRSLTLVTTYGDPVYYSKTGFRVLPENTIAAPLKLSNAFSGDHPTCVKEFNIPLYW